MAQLTIRGVPEDVMVALKQLAKEQGISVNRLVLGMICEYLGYDIHGKPLRRRDLNRLAGIRSKEMLAGQSRVDDGG